jgi:hypothetical protein
MTRFAYLIFLVVLISCAKNATPPAIVVNTYEQPELPVSTINLPITIKLNSVFEEANKSIPTTFKGKEDVCEGVSYDYSFKRERIEFNGSGSGLTYTIPASYQIKLNYCPKCTDLFDKNGYCLTPRVYASCGVGESPRRVEIVYKTAIGITEDFSISSKTELRSFRSIDPCKITVFNYNATDQVEKEIRAALKDGARSIDEEIEALPLQKELKAAVKQLSEPIDMGTYGKLHLNPDKIDVSPLKFSGNSLDLKLKLAARPALGTKLSKNEKTIDSENGSGFRIYFPIRLAYDTLSMILQEQFEGQEFTHKRKVAVVDSISIFGSGGNKVLIKLKFSGSKKGVIYLSGAPQLDAANQRFSFKDLQLTVESKDLLLKTARWLFDKQIEKRLEEAFELDLTKELKKIEELMLGYLNGEVSDGVHLETSIRNIELQRFEPRESDLMIDILFAGNAKATISF